MFLLRLAIERRQRVSFRYPIQYKTEGPAMVTLIRKLVFAFISLSVVLFIIICTFHGVFIRRGMVQASNNWAWASRS